MSHEAAGAHHHRHAHRLGRKALGCAMRRRCGYCEELLPLSASGNRLYCSQECRELMRRYNRGAVAVAVSPEDWPPGACPRERGDDGPCIHVGCRYHLYADVTPGGALRVSPEWLRMINEPGPFPDGIQTCALDTDGEWTLEAIGQLWGITRERVRQLQDIALAKSRRIAELRGLSRHDCGGFSHQRTGAELWASADAVTSRQRGRAVAVVAAEIRESISRRDG